MALEGPRQQAKVLYPLPEIVLLLLCATLAGADDFVEMQLWGKQNLAFRRRFLPYRHDIASHDTLGETIRVIDPELFKACFTSWVEGLREAEPDIVAIDGKTSHERRYYLSSAKLDAKTFARAVRCHWHIENRLHWVMDVAFHDDLARFRTGHGPENMAVVKHIAMNLIRQAKPTTSLKNRRKRAGWNLDYLHALLRIAA